MATVAIGVGITLLRLHRPNDKVGEWLLTLATAFLVAGAVTVLVRLVETARTEREKWTNRLQALQAARDTVHVVRLLVSTRDVKTYFEQVPELVRVRADLRRLAAEVESEVKTNQDRQLHASIRAMSSYLDRLGWEYQRSYWLLARQQRLDEARLTKLINDAASRNEANLTEQLNVRLPAQAMLSSDRFRCLDNFCNLDLKLGAFGTEYAQAKEYLEDKAGRRASL